MSVTVNGDPVPETTGGAVRWEDVPNRHAYCDAEIGRLRASLDAAKSALTDLQACYDQLSEQHAVTRERLRGLAARWETAASDYDDHGPDSPQAETYRDCAQALSSIADPGITGAGTEHLAAQLAERKAGA